MPFISMPLLNLLADSKFESNLLTSMRKLCIHSRPSRRTPLAPLPPPAKLAKPAKPTRISYANPKLLTSYRCSAKFPRSSRVRPQRRPSALGTIAEE